MPVVGVPLDEFFACLGTTLPSDQLVDELHRFGCSVEGRVVVVRYRCTACAALSESPKGEPPPAQCDRCGADLRAQNPAPQGTVETLRMELLAVRPDVFDPAGLARAMKGFLGLASGAPRYAVQPSDWHVDVDAALAGPEVRRPRIACAIVEGVQFSEASLRSLMKLQENVHWALGRDRKLASVGVYDLATVKGPRLRYRAAGWDELSFVPLGFDGSDPGNALTPEQILARHPKGKAFAWLLESAGCVPLLQDAAEGVLAMIPIINSERTRVTRESRDLFLDCTGLDDRQVDRALAIVVTSLLESSPGATVRSVTIDYPAGSRVTPDFTPQRVSVDAQAAARLIGIAATATEIVELLKRMRHDAHADGDRIDVDVAPFRSDIMHERDLVEDIAIAYGYDNIPNVLVTAATFGAPHPREQLATRARTALIGLGVTEVITLPLTNETAAFERTGLLDDRKHVTLAHPISVDQTMVRVSTLPGLMETLALNLGHPYPQRIFEVGLCAQLDESVESGASEFLVASAALAGDGLGYADIRALTEALLRELLAGTATIEWRRSTSALFVPGRGAELWIDDIFRGRLGEIHPAALEHHRIIHPVAALELRLQA